MRILIIGRSGQVAGSLLALAERRAILAVAVGRPHIDLLNPGSLRRAADRAEPTLIVNAAAYTAVDRAEAEPERAFAVNGAGAGAVATLAAERSVPVIHLSTDYVFDGLSDRAYRETDPTAPISAYGRSKLLGEERVTAATDNHVILRTAWVFSPRGTNFVRTMLRLARDRDEIRVVADQRGSPTSADDIAAAILFIGAKLKGRAQDTTLRGVFHMTGAGDTTWAGFATTIFMASERFGGPSARVLSITTEDYPTPAPRPRNSRLDNTKLRRIFGVSLPDWQTSCRSCVHDILRTPRSGRVEQ